MEIVVKGRNTEVTDRFRDHVEEKLQKIEQLAPRAQRVEVEVLHEGNPSQADTSERIEITVRDKGPVIRAEAAASDRYGALDLALDKLFERLRRARDRRKDHGRRSLIQEKAEPLNLTPEDVNVKKEKEEAPQASVPTVPGEEVENQLGDSPVLVRQKLYEAREMSVEQALYEMELVGHDFYLFIDEETKQPCAVYHRRGWTYGVIRLDVKAQ
ncbi:MAG: ribosome-associated translation inhibitor RaiA [Actinomycetaceae bacterium]|nr:ribosome-associated translation inhibitor RaiA [Actinomycetaceae bacterium]